MSIHRRNAAPKGPLRVVRGAKLALFGVCLVLGASGAFGESVGLYDNVKVIFTADDGYEIVGENAVTLGTVTENIVFGEGDQRGLSPFDQA